MIYNHYAVQINWIEQNSNAGHFYQYMRYRKITREKVGPHNSICHTGPDKND